MRRRSVVGPFWMLVALSACGRLGYQAHSVDRDAGMFSGDGATAALENALYISPTGDDTNPGTADRPFRSFGRALAQLTPGRTLVLQPGEYSVASRTGLLKYDCGAESDVCGGAACASGMNGAPIRIVALPERRARILAGPGTGAAIEIARCRDIIVEGIVASGIDDASPEAAGEHVIQLVETSRVTLRRMLGTTPSRHSNAHVFEVFESTDTLIEESEAHSFIRAGFLAWHSPRTTFRRNYANSHAFPPIPGGLDDPCDGIESRTKSDGFSVWGSADALVENNVAEDVCSGFNAYAHEGGNEGTRFIGNLVRASVREAFLAYSRCQDQTPCPSDRIARDIVFENNVALNAERGFWFRGGQNLAVRHGTSIGHTNWGIVFDQPTFNQGFSASVRAESSLAASGGTAGVRVLDVESWSVRFSNAFGDSIPFDLPTVDASNTSFDPNLNGCAVYIPPGSPARGAGPGGTDIGANVVYRTVNGALTDEFLWNATSGRFPCGAAVPGLNDAPSVRCDTLHERFNVGTNGCMWPPP